MDDSSFEKTPTERGGHNPGHDFSRIAVYSPSDRPGSGQALPALLRGRFEGSLGADLSAVRVHTGLASARAAQAAHARAFTLGQDIHFNDGAYDPVSGEGQRVLAHEVAHTVQQAGAGGRVEGMTEPGDAAEAQADAAASAMVAARSAQVSPQPAAIARILESNLPRPKVDFPPGLLAACPTLADWNKIKVNEDPHSLVEAFKAAYLARLAYDAANEALDTGAATKPSQGASDQAQKAAGDYIRASTELSVQCTSLASRLFAPKFNLNPAASEPARPAPQQNAPGLNTPPPQPQPGLTTDALAAKLGNELLALANRQGSIISGAVRSSRHAKQVVATFLPHFRETLPFAWSTVQEADDEAIKSWFSYYDLDLQKDKSQPRKTGDDANVFFNGKDMRYGDVLDTFISEANKAGFTFNRNHAWEVTAGILNGRQNLEDKLSGGPPETKGLDDKSKKLAAPSVALQSQLNFTGHRTLVSRGATNSQDPPTWQVTGQVTVPLHPEGKSGFEISAQGSVSFVMTQDGRIIDGTLQLSDPSATVTNVQGALQLAWVKPFLEGAMQFQAFAQAVGGASWVEDRVNVTTGAVTLKPAGMVQGVTGMQLVFVVPDTGGHVQLFIQLQTSVTGTSGQPSTLDLQGSGGVQIQFNLF
ncbi:MAG TPA: DUF4157 domain-containing protein [Acidobacteriaceae bacterium]|nr:DUF4157 domain-containing protein [Acidobacteriaceae bacterium]